VIYIGATEKAARYVIMLIYLTPVPVEWTRFRTPSTRLSVPVKKMKINDPVLVYAPSFYKEARIGIYVGPCKDHEGAFRVLLINPDAPIKEVCANPENGDTIEILQPKPPS
jgi:hypothetical protein